VREFCPNGTKDNCCHERKSLVPCEKVHFVQLIQPHTDKKLGDCSYLNACRHLKTCKFVHYEIDRGVNQFACMRRASAYCCCGCGCG
jgi:mRNA (2'-O-methyladenosine-N6-)-methyltransferase